jgi:HlyD family secretion protein
MKKKTLYIIIAAAVLLLIILMVGKKQGWLGKDKSVKVVVEKALKRSITEIVTATGKIQPEVELVITPDVSGEIVELYVAEGDKVKKGQPLARINPENYKSYLEQMEAGVNAQRANLANARARQIQIEAQLLRSRKEYDRISALHKKGAVSEAEYEASNTSWQVATAELEAAKQSVQAALYSVRSSEASLKDARVNLTKTTLLAPMDGTISKLSKKKGERVVGTSQFEGTEIMRIADLTTMEVNIEVSENDITRVKLNDTATIEVDAFRDRKFTGVVTRIANSAISGVAGFSSDQVTNFEVKIRLLRSSYEDLIPQENPETSPFRPGMSASVDIRTAIEQDVITVPIEAVTTRKDTTGSRLDSYRTTSDKPAAEKSAEEKQREKKAQLEELRQYVFVYSAGEVRIREVKAGIQDTEVMHIIEGIKDGEEVVVAPYGAITKDLKSGDKVKKVSRDELFKGK